jgi:hypothetical protein
MSATRRSTTSKKIPHRGTHWKWTAIYNLATLSENEGASRDTNTPERYVWAVFNAALLTGFTQTLFYDTPLYPYRRVAFGVAFIAFAAWIVTAIVRLVRRR